VIGLVAIQGAAPRTLEQWFESRSRSREYGGYTQIPVTTLSVLPPGKYVALVPGSGWSAHLSGRSGAEIAFTDHAGSNWVRRARGHLEELPDGPLDYFARYGLTAPYEFQTPEPI
jgi:hypothetical protein